MYNNSHRGWGKKYTHILKTERWVLIEKPEIANVNAR